MKYVDGDTENKSTFTVRSLNVWNKIKTYEQKKILAYVCMGKDTSLNPSGMGWHS